MTTTPAAPLKKADVQKLQRAIVDGLEDVKGQDIQVFNTEHLSPLFERVIVCSGTSNRQTQALAASVRDAVREAGFPKPRIEGQDNGEWIIVDCGAAVAHILQPAFRQYYMLEELWGEKPVRLRLGAPKPKPRAPAEAEAPARRAQPKVKPTGAGTATKKVAASAADTGATAKKAAATKASVKAPAKTAASGKSAAAAPSAAKPRKPVVRAKVVAKPVVVKPGAASRPKASPKGEAAKPAARRGSR